MFCKSAVALGVAGLGLAVGLSAAAQTPSPSPAGAPLPAMVSTQVPVLPPRIKPAPRTENTPQYIASQAIFAQDGWTESAWIVGEAYRAGSGVAKNADTAAAWLRVAATQGSRGAMDELADLYAEPHAPKPPPGEPDWRQKAADAGWGMAQYALGRMYADGHGRPKDPVTAYKWFALAAAATDGPVAGTVAAARRDAIAAEMTRAERDDARTQVAQWLAVTPSLDQITDKGVMAIGASNYSAAVALLTKAAVAGNARAQTYLGLLYEGGVGVKKDWLMAASLFRKAAEQDDPNGEHMVSLALSNGAALSRDLPAAADWSHKAALHGLAVAEYDQGFIYHKGRGVTQDDAAALAWLRKAAAQGESHAQALLGGLYASGTGVPKDLVEAYKWQVLATIYAPANTAVSNDAQAAIASLTPSMTQEQIDTATAAANAWQPVFEVPR